MGWEGNLKQGKHLRNVLFEKFSKSQASRFEIQNCADCSCFPNLRAMIGMYLFSPRANSRVNCLNHHQKANWNGFLTKIYLISISGKATTSSCHASGKENSSPQNLSMMGTRCADITWSFILRASNHAPRIEQVLCLTSIW